MYARILNAAARIALKAESQQWQAQNAARAAVAAATDEDSGGNGSDTAFTLSQTGSAASTIVSINGTVQEATNTYTVSGTTLTFNEAPATDDKIQVRNFFSGSELQPASKFQSYTTTQRNALSPSNGDVVYNSTTHKFQGYANGGWVDFH